MDTPHPRLAPDLEAHRRLWSCLAAVTVASCTLGSLVTLGPVRALLATTLMALAGAAWGLVLAGDLPHVRRPVRTGAAVCAGATVVLVGVPGAAHGVGVLPVALLVAASPPVLARLTARAARSSGPGRVPGEGTRDDLGTLLRLCDDDQLAAAWRDSGTSLREASSAEHAARVVAVRQRYLDELERRAPEDFPHWLSAQSLDR